MASHGNSSSQRRERRITVARRTTTIVLATALTALVTTAFGSVAQAAPSQPQSNAALPSINSGSHAYRHGVIPTLSWWHAHHAAGSSAAATSANNLSYGGSIDGVGVTTGPPKVYIVLWGSQWGTQSTSSAGYPTFSGDPSGMAPDLEAFFSGLGTNNELWSGVMTQYCQGIATGAQSCPASAAHVGYPYGGALAGVWEDTSSSAPSQATAHQLAQEAVNAATHFGNTTQASNRNTQYFIVSPTGTNPDGFNTSSGNFCAWHDYTADSTMDGGGAVNSPDGILAFTNMPYVTDAGASCGQNFVNGGSAGIDDGVTIVGGHEYAETITDQYPAGGWTNSSGYENGDLCAWISSGQGASQNITLSTGTFAVQSTYANDFNGGAGGCEVSHPIIGSPSGNTVTVSNPGNQTSTVGSSASLQITATDSGGASLAYSASGLPAGLSINSSSGLISGTPTASGTSSVTVTATDSTGASGSTAFSWTVNPRSSCAPRQLLGNPGFETGSAAPWRTTPGVIQNTSTGMPSHSGNWFAWLDGYGYPHTDTLAQTVTLPTGCTNYTFSFWRYIDTYENQAAVFDTLRVLVLNKSGNVVQLLARYSNLNADWQYDYFSFSLAKYAGQTITLKFIGVETDNGGGTTDFLIDDTALNVS